MAGELVVGRLQKLAVRRHLKDLADAGARGFVFSESHALEAITFIERCCHHYKGEWAGRPVELMPDQLFIVWCLFGWRRKESEVRRFRKAYLSMARKWGKSLFAACVALFILVYDNPIEPGAEVYAVATKEDQAKIVHNDAKAMVKRSPSLKRRLRIRTKSIEFEAMDSFFMRIGSDSDGTDGQNLHGAILDELHAWREVHRGLHEKLMTAGVARRQPLWLTITTAGDDKSQIWMEEDDYAIRCVEEVLSGVVIDDSQFVFICRIDDEDDPFDETKWIKANPHLGETVGLDDCREFANEARSKPAAISKLKRYICNIKTASRERAILPEVWKLGEAAVPDIVGRAGFGGLDLGRSNDFAAVALALPRMEGDELFIDLKVKCWTCQQTELKIAQSPLAEFIDKGQLIVCPGDSIRYADILDYCLNLAKECEVKTWAFDPNFAKVLAEQMQNEHGLNVFSFSQSPRFYNEPIRYLQKMLKDGRLIHGGDECLTWQAGNLTIVRNNKDEWMPAKLGGPFKIDGMVASLMAISECLYHGRTATDSSYEILTI